MHLHVPTPTSWVVLLNGLNQPVLHMLGKFSSAVQQWQRRAAGAGRLPASLRNGGERQTPEDSTSALGLSARNTSLCTLLFVYIRSSECKYSKETKCKEHESQASPEINQHSLLPKYLLLPNLNQPHSEWAAGAQSSLTKTVTLTF